MSATASPILKAKIRLWSVTKGGTGHRTTYLVPAPSPALARVASADYWQQLIPRRAVFDVSETGQWDSRWADDCPDCQGGQSFRADDRCSTCNGWGSVIPD